MKNLRVTDTLLGELQKLELNGIKRVVIQDSDDYYYLTSGNTIKVRKQLELSRSKRVGITQDILEFYLKEYFKVLKVQTGVSLKDEEVS